MTPHFVFGHRTNALSLSFARFSSCRFENASNSSEESATFSITSVGRGIVFVRTIFLVEFFIIKLEHAHDSFACPCLVHRKQYTVLVPSLYVRYVLVACSLCVRWAQH